MDTLGWRPDASRHDCWRGEEDITSLLEWLATLFAGVAEATGVPVVGLPEANECPTSTILSMGVDQRWRGRRTHGAPARPFPRTA
jgi:hypothetical protein